MKNPIRTISKYLGVGIAIQTLILPASFGAITFQGVGIPKGAFGSLAPAVSGDGKVVLVSPLSANTPVQIFLWTAAQGTKLKQIPNLPQADATDLNFDGSVIVGEGELAILPGKSIAFRWSAVDGLTNLGTLPSNFMSFNHPTCVSADGNIVAGYVDEAGVLAKGFRWTKTSGQMTSLGTLTPGKESPAFGISRNGRVIVGRSIDADGSQQAYQWSLPLFGQTAMKKLGTLETTGLAQSGASAANYDGSVIVGQSTKALPDKYFACRWILRSNGIFVEALGDLPGGKTESSATSVSDDGTVVVGYSDDGTDPIGVTTATIWTKKTGLESLKTLLQAAGFDLSDWHLRFAMDISADGKVIVGIGSHGDADEGFVITGADELLQFAKIQGIQVQDTQPLAKSARLTGTADPGTKSVQIQAGHRRVTAPVIADSRTQRGRWTAQVPLAKGDNLVEVSSATPAPEEFPIRLHVAIGK